MEKFRVLPAQPSTEEETLHCCYDGWVYLGYIVPMPDGTEEEVIEAVPCRRCSECR
jgi:hypothetical protein